MEAFLWAALGFWVIAACAGSAFVGIRAWRAWNDFVSLAAAGGAAAERLASAAEQLAARGGQAAGRSGELVAAAERLERSISRGRILVGALGEGRDLLQAARALVPRA
jgi:hypothetical protein